MPAIAFRSTPSAGLSLTSMPSIRMRMKLGGACLAISVEIEILDRDAVRLDRLRLAAPGRVGRQRDHHVLEREPVIAERLRALEGHRVGGIFALISSLNLLSPSA